MRKWTCFSLTVMFYLLGNSDLVAVAGTKERAIANDDPLNRQNLDISSIKNKNNANQFVVFPVGINVGQSTLDFNPLIRGLENGAKAVKFKDWLIPFDVVTQALQFQVTNLANGQLELRSPGLVTRIDPQELTTDSELGLVISPQEIETIFGVPSKFDLIEYAIVFNPPWLGVEAKQEHTEETPPDLTGLPRIDAPRLTLTNVAQDLNISGNSGSSGNSRYQGNFKALGTAFDSSWFIRVNQPDLTKFGNWQLQEAQFLRQGKQTDYVLGSQSSFWPSDTNNQLWGITALKRWGFSPPPVSGGGAFNANQRLQADKLGRTIAGEAEPGTLVQLTRGFREEVFAETLVDSSGVYRFENVPTGSLSSSNNYSLLLYPNGQLTAQPIIREATFTSVSGQLPHGASALTVSAGSTREFTDGNSFFGNAQAVVGAVSYRYGLTEDMTVGIGTVYDRSMRILGETFYQPGNLPLQIGISAITDPDDGLNINSRLNWQPSSKIDLNLSSDSFGERFNVSWRAFRNLGFIAEGNSRDRQISSGIQASAGGKSYQLSGRITTTTDNQWRWNFNSRFRRWRFASLGNEVISSNSLNYSFASKTTGAGLDIGQGLFMNYESSRQSDRLDRLTTLGWSYRSPARSSDGRNLWNIELGYGLGSQGNGLVTSFNTSIIPGLSLRARYRQVTATSNTDSFQITLSPFLNLQQGIRPDNSNFEHLRQQGGLLIQPFLDRNSNGKQERGEETYLEDLDLLVAINNKPLESFRPLTRSNGAQVRLAPETYRIDIDPAGFPLDWKASQFNHAVEVVAGSYTPVPIPLITAYSLSGVATDRQNKPLGGARVEAIPVDKGIKMTSVTNGAGVFYLEGLSQGTYRLLINDRTAQPDTITINETSESFQEINLSDSR